MENYHTTELRETTSYPTYQYYAVSQAEKLPPEDVFRICILHTMKWLRDRLRSFGTLPAELMLPEPDGYEALTMASLRSFSCQLGPLVDVIYVEKEGVWSFRLTETDQGVNVDKPYGRQPVIGRSFVTEIAFRMGKDSVEAGARTSCIEPKGTEAPCEVFRPTAVKEITKDPRLGFAFGGFKLDGRPFLVDTKAALEHLAPLLGEGLDLPVLMIAQSGYVEDMPAKTPSLETPALPAMGISLGGFGSGRMDGFTLDLSKTDLKTEKAKLSSKRSKPAKEPKPSTLTAAPAPKRERCPELPYEELADRLVGFAVVCYVQERFFTALKNKYGIALAHGDVMLLRHGRELERHAASVYVHDVKGWSEPFYQGLKESPKRAAFSYGDVMFHADARVAELRRRRHEAATLEERCEAYREENQALKEKLREQSQQLADMRASDSALRETHKKLENAEKDRDSMKIAYEQREAYYQEREEAYRRSGALAAFYRDKAVIAAGYPTCREEVCDWAEESFGAQLILLPRARTALRKYAGRAAAADICDGLLYLDAYARYRRGEITEETLALYADQCHWEAMGCGKETLRVKKDDYTVTYQDKSYLLDMHIKAGVSAEQLIRIYFCWDKDLDRVLIGYMPDHLPIQSY